MKLPGTDIQALAENNEPVYSGQAVSGDICFQIAANDASSLALVRSGYTNPQQQIWFALR